MGRGELLLVPPRTDCARAEHLIRHRRRAPQRPDRKPLTFRIGIAEWSADGRAGRRALVALADERTSGQDRGQGPPPCAPAYRPPYRHGLPSRPRGPDGGSRLSASPRASTRAEAAATWARGRSKDYITVDPRGGGRYGKRASALYTHRQVGARARSSGADPQRPCMPVRVLRITAKARSERLGMPKRSSP